MDEFSLEEKEEMALIIEEWLVTCNNDKEYEELDCINCPDLESCYYKAISKSEHEYAESLDYGGYDTEEEFWEQTYGY